MVKVATYQCSARLLHIISILQELAKGAEAFFMLAKDAQEISEATICTAATSRIECHAEDSEGCIPYVNRKPDQRCKKKRFLSKKFGTKAKKCILLCSFSKLNSTHNSTRFSFQESFMPQIRNRQPIKKTFLIDIGFDAAVVQPTPKESRR